MLSSRFGKIATTTSSASSTTTSRVSNGGSISTQCNSTTSRLQNIHPRVVSAFNYRPATFYNAHYQYMNHSNKNGSNTCVGGKNRRWNPVLVVSTLALVLGIWSIYLRSQLTFWELENDHHGHHSHQSMTQEDKKGASLPLASNEENSKKRVCFIQSVYGQPGQVSLDRPQNVTALKEEYPDFYEFYYFTNMKDVVVPGWKKMTTTFETKDYNRYITKSRYPKFMAWKYPEIQQNCYFVMYLDGHFIPRPHKRLKFQMLSKQALSSEFGLIQTTHEKGGTLLEEFERIVSGSKDIQEHIDLSVQWLQQQPDFNNNNITLYWNAVFGYDPTNHWFQKAAQFFWDRYSLELDSWRDQPLWAYTLYHFGIKPLEMRHDTLHSFILESMEAKGDHHYYDDHQDGHSVPKKVS